MEMTAKQYLSEIKRMDLCIDQKQIEFDTMQKQRTYISGMDYASERVQTSTDGMGFTSNSDKLLDLQLEINEEIDKFYIMKHERINQIQQLSKTEYIKVLFKRYVQYQSFETISSDLNISYYWTCHLHGKALNEFKEKFLKDSK